MGFFICTDRGGKRRKCIGGAKITTYGVDTISSLFMHSYRNIKRCCITLQKCPGGKYATPPTVGGGGGGGGMP